MPAVITLGAGNDDRVQRRARLAALALLAALAGAVSQQRSLAQEPTGLTAAIALEKAMVDSIAKCEKSVVAIARGPKGSRHKLLDPEYIPTEYATGVVVGREGYILTAYHVLGDTDENIYAVWVGGRAYLVEKEKGQIVGGDATYDLAVLKIEADSLTPIPLGDATELKKGQIVISLGNPLAIARDGEPSATWGIVSNLRRKAAPRSEDGGENQKETLHHYGTLIQTDARLERGTSGGALLNLKGEMVGLTTIAAALPGSEKAAGFAIPVDDTFKGVVQKLKLGQKVAYGFLGVAPDDSSRADAQRSDGIKIVNVVHGTPAASAELKVGDYITHVDGQPLHTAGDLILEVARHAAGEKVQVRFVRNERALTRDVTLSKKYIRNQRPDIATAEPPSWRGVTVDFTTAHPRFVELSFDADTKGCVVVTDVDPNSPAWRAGLRSGIFISHVGQRRVTSPEEFYRAAAASKGAVRLQPSSQFNRADAIVVQPM